MQDSRDLPEFEWLPLARQQADEERRRAEWSPPTPRQVVELGGTEGARYLADTAALQALVLEALSEIQCEMHAHLPLAHCFWNTDPPRPKSENEMSNVLARELRSALAERRVVVNREVQVNPAPGGASGQRTDLHIQAVEEGREPLLVVVEVKGAWNAKLDTAMEDQLTGQYLANESGACGVYLVAWCRAEDWDTSVPKEETRCRSASARSLDETSEFFAAQADELGRRTAIPLKAFVLDYSLRPPS